MPTPAIAANAYAALSRMTDPFGAAPKAAGEAGAANGTGAASFNALLKDAVGQVAEAGRNSDAQSRALVDGKANLVDVVTAVADTEAAIETLVSVRDKVIQAYQSIMAMQI
jgi:flagellar hook-basal body complex protein FliE